MRFIHTSDLQYSGMVCRDRKMREPESIETKNAEFVIVTGNLTKNGFDGSSLGCINYGGDEYQLQGFTYKFMRTIERSGKSVYLCPGISDKGVSWSIYKPVIQYIRKRHKDVKYSFERGGIRFICCGIYPKDLKWLKKQLHFDKSHIIFFHYSLGGNSWTSAEKDAFAKVIAPYYIAGILVGQSVISEIQSWCGHTVVQSGEAYSVITCEDGQIAEIDYVHV